MVTTTCNKRSNDKTLHRWVTDQILQDIRVGRLPLGKKLPSQGDLVEKFKVSVNTIRQSLATLERRGIIRKEHGRGSFVSLQSNRTGKSTELKSFGLIFERAGKPEDHPAEAEIVQAFVNTCREHHIRFTCVETDVDAHAGGRELIKTFDGVSLDGLCVFFHSGDNAFERLEPLAREFAAPVAFFPAFQEPSVPIDCVDIELRAGLGHLMKYLLAMGHRRIGFVGSHIAECLAGDPRRSTGGRWQMYSETLKEAGIPIDPSLLVEIPYGQEPTDRIGKQVIDLVRRKDPATAIYTYNDWMAQHVIQWLWRNDIHVPRDVSVTGMDDVSFARHMVPALTTSACPYVKAAQTIIGLMQKRLAQPDLPIQRITIPSELIVRASVGAVK
jgi:LacI family transcriptional regulator